MRETETQSGFFSSNYTKYSRIVGIHLILDWNFAETLLALQQQQQQLMTVYDSKNKNKYLKSLESGIKGRYIYNGILQD